MSEFGKYLRKIREQQNLSLRGLGRRVGLSASYICKIELGEFKPPSEEKIKAISDALGQDQDHMLALAGRVSSDLVEIILKNPAGIARALRAHDGEGK